MAVVLRDLSGAFLGNRRVTAIHAGQRQLWPDPYVTEVMRDNPRAFWPLNETEGSIAWSLTGAHHGQYIGTPGTAYQLGQEEGVGGRRAVRLNGAGLIEIPHDNVFNASGTDSATVELWARLDAVGSTRSLMGKFATSGTFARPWQIFREAEGGVGGRLGSASQNFDTTTHALVNNQWHHIAFTYSGLLLILYVDGLQRSTAAAIATPVNDTTPVQIGARRRTEQLVFGWLQWAAFYRPMLSPARLLAHYQAAQ